MWLISRLISKAAPKGLRRAHGRGGRAIAVPPTMPLPTVYALTVGALAVQLAGPLSPAVALTEKPPPPITPASAAAQTTTAAPAATTPAAAAPGTTAPAATAPSATTPAATAPGTATPATTTPATTTPAATTPAATTPAAPAGALGAATPTRTGALPSRRPSHHRKISTAALVGAALAALLILLSAAWAAMRWLAIQPRWTSSLAYSLEEASYRASATWSEFLDWARLGR